MASVGNTMGCLLMGAITSGMLWGVSCSQMFHFFTRYRNEPSSLQAFVCVVFISDTVHQALITESVYTYLVTGYGDASRLLRSNNGLTMQILFNALTGLLVQGFFVHRIWRLGSKRNRFFVVPPLIVLVIAEFGVSIAYAVKGFILVEFGQLNKVRTLSICINAFAAGGDVAIAVCLCTILHYSRTEFPKSSALINRLISASLSTGLLTSICAVICLITYFAVPNSFVYMTFYFLIGRLYTNSLLGTLNARKHIKNAPSSGGDISLSFRDGGASAYQVQPSQRGQNGITVRIDTTKDTQHDFSPEDYESAHSKRHLDSV